VLSDWYWATDGKQVLYRSKQGKDIGFQARPVVGGVFIKALMDAPAWRKWSRKSPGSQKHGQ
jgi:hypothetical protein